MKRPIILLIIALTISSAYYFFKIYKKQKPNANIIAIVNNEPISATDFKDKLHDIKSNYNTNKNIDLSELKDIVLKRMIIEKMLLQEAEDKSITVTKDELNRYTNNIKQHYTTKTFKQILLNQFKTMDSWEEDINKRLLIEKTLSKVIIENINVTEKEIDLYYKHFYSEKVKESKVRIAQIFTHTRTNAEKALEQLSAGLTFAEAAKRFSKSPEASKGGLLGTFAKGEGIELFDLAFNMKPSEITGILQSDYGFHILRLLEYISSEKISFEEAKPLILSEIINEKESLIYEEWLLNKFKNSKIIKNVALLESIK